VGGRAKPGHDTGAVPPTLISPIFIQGGSATGRYELAMTVGGHDSRFTDSGYQLRPALVSAYSGVSR
jgi:hypothetical protein